MRLGWEEEMENCLVEKFKNELCFKTIFVSIMWIFTVIIFLGGGRVVGIIALCVSFWAFFWVLFPMLRDVKAIKKRMFEKVAGKILRYEQKSMGAKTYYIPVVLDDVSGEEKEFYVHLTPKDREYIFFSPSTGIGERYLLLYLKHSKTLVCRKEPKSYGDDE